jgi:hypothetical protein
MLVVLQAQEKIQKKVRFWGYQKSRSYIKKKKVVIVLGAFFLTTTPQLEAWLILANTHH